MHEYAQWAIYNFILFGSLYAVAKLIEQKVWHIIENYEQYKETLNKWSL